MTLNISIKIQNITPIGSNYITLEFIISAWEFHENQNWSLFSWYADLELDTKGIKIEQIIPAANYDNNYFNADLSRDLTSVSGLGFTGNPFASIDPDGFYVASIIARIDQLPSIDNPLSIKIHPVSTKINQSGKISLETVASSKQLYPETKPSPTGDLAAKIGTINEKINHPLLEPLIILSQAFNHQTTISGDLSKTGLEDSTITGNISATDPEGLTDGSIYSIASSKNPTNGAASIAAATGKWTYTPNLNFNGSDSFTVLITDDKGGTTEQLINLSIAAIDDPALISGDLSKTGVEDSTITGTIFATDPEGLTDGSIYSIASGKNPTNGTATIAAASGKWTYTPNSNFNGSDSFSVLITDDQGGATEQIINLTIAALENSFVAITPSAAIIDEGSILTVNIQITNPAGRQVLYYLLSGAGITSSDFSLGALNGSGRITNDGNLNFNHTIANDLTTEGAELLEIKFFKDIAFSEQIGSTANVIITDSSTKQNIAPTGRPTVKGNLKPGSILTISDSTIKDGDNLNGYKPAFEYNWETSIDGINWSKLNTADALDNNNTYTLTAAEVNKQIRAIASYTDGYGTFESISSEASSKLTAHQISDELIGSSLDFNGDGKVDSFDSILMTRHMMGTFPGDSIKRDMPGKFDLTVMQRKLTNAFSDISFDGSLRLDIDGDKLISVFRDGMMITQHIHKQGASDSPWMPPGFNPPAGFLAQMQEHLKDLIGF